MTKRDELLKVAQNRVRSGGYNNFSFRDIAAEVGIKSASVHYHFPTKADLGAELARQYTDDFLRDLQDPAVLLNAGKNPITTYIDKFRRALVIDKKMCLCGLLGAETDGLPDKVQHETKRFFEQNITWLEQAYIALQPESSGNAKASAIKLISLLEGAIMLSKSMGDDTIFEAAVAELQTRRG